MEKINARQELFQEVNIKDNIALFTELRIDPNTIPSNVKSYELRHGDDNSYPETLEKQVTINFFGTILLLKEIELDEENKLSLNYEDFGFTGEEVTLESYLKTYQSEEKHRNMTCKMKEIENLIENEFDSRMKPSIFSYILEKGIENVAKITKEEICEMEKEKHISPQFVRAFVKVSVQICRNYTPMEILNYIKKL